MKTFVIAGTRQEFNAYVKSKEQNNLVGPQYIYVDSPIRIRGIQDPHGVFVGNWLGRPDIVEIVETLMIASVHSNPALGKIYTQVKPKVKPTPKYKGLQINTMIVDEAAKLMGEAMDQEILKNLHNKINGGVI